MGLSLHSLPLPRLQPPPHKLPLHPLTPPVILSVAKDLTLITPHRPLTRLIPFPQPESLNRLHHPPRGKNLGQRLARRQVHPAFPFWRLFPRGSRERLQVLAPLNSFTINT